MKRFKITVSYDGTNYVGWQVQPNGVSVQGQIETALLRLSNETVKVHGSGRTDQGVHAQGQVAHFDLEKEFTTKGIMRALNAVLPTDIRIMRCATCPADFHSRKHAVHKTYCYFIWNAPTMPPTKRFYQLHVKQKLDVEAMRKAASMLVGLHDFASFTANPKTVVYSTIRRVFDLKVRKRGSEIVIIARGEGFLYKMVRALAGWLLRVGKGEVPAEDTASILERKLRTSQVPTAPARGLFLWRVCYKK